MEQMVNQVVKVSMLTFTPNNHCVQLVPGSIKKTPARGFTLIEMMVVVVLMGLVDASRIALQVQNLLARAAILNQSIELTADNHQQLLVDGKPALDLPLGWTLQQPSLLVVNGSGYCVPAEITFVSGKQEYIVVQVRNHKCSVGFSLHRNAV
jgi:prepilin-type N-terminal cleavage/methylation domain-containing protein